MLKLLYFVLALTISNASQVVQAPLELPGQQGVVVVQWTPTLAHPAVFNHFVNAPGRLLLRNHYDSYSLPVLELSIGAVHHVAQPTGRLHCACHAHDHSRGGGTSARCSRPRSCWTTRLWATCGNRPNPTRHGRQERGSVAET